MLKKKIIKRNQVVHPKGNQPFIKRKNGLSKSGKQKWQRVRVYKKMPKGWKVTEGVMTNPAGYKMIDNKKSWFKGERKTAYLKVKE